MIKFQITGTMAIDAEVPGKYTSSRQADQDGHALVADNPIMEIVNVSIGFRSQVIVQAECIFTHRIGTIEKRDSITFYLEPAVMQSAILPGAILPNEDLSVADWYQFITAAVAPGIVNTLTERVTATPI